MRVVRPLLIPIALFSAARRRTRFRAVGCGRLHASHAGDAGRPAGRRLAHVAPDVRPSGAQPARPDQHDQRRRPAAGVGLDDAGGPSGDDAARARWDDVPRRAMRLCRGARRPRRLSYLGVSCSSPPDAHLVAFPPPASPGFSGVGSEEARPAGAGLRPPLKRYVRFSRIPLSRRRPRVMRTDGRNQTDKVHQVQLAVERSAGQGLPSPTPPPLVPMRPHATHHPSVELVEELPDVSTLVHPRRTGLSC